MTGRKLSVGVVVGMAVLAVLLIVALILGIVGGAIPVELPTRVIGPPVCEGLNSEGRRFKAKTRDVELMAITESNEGRGVVYRRSANTNSDLDVAGRLLPAGCQVGFVGFCIGEPLQDMSSGNAPLDQQWFILPDDHGYVHGGVVQELPPGTIGKEPGKCNGGREEPREIQALGALPARLSGKMVVQLRAKDAATVASAIYTVNESGRAEWHPLAIDTDGSDGFSLSLDTAGFTQQADATLLFVACWAGNVPGRATVQATVEAGQGGSPSKVPVPTDLGLGSSVACKQVAGGS